MLKEMMMFILLLSGLVFAGNNNYQAETNKKIAKTDTVKGDYFFAGSDLRFEGYAQSDVYAFCRSVDLSGQTGDDFYAFCQSVTSRGNVGGNLFTAGEKVEIEGVIHGDVFAAGGAVIIRPGAVIEGTVHAGTGYFELGENSIIKGDLKVGARSATLAGKVNGGSTLHLEKINFAKTFSSSDTVDLTLREELEESIPNAPANLKITIEPRKHFFQKGFFFWMLISAIIIGLIIIALFPELPARFEEVSSTQWAQNLGYGALFFLVTPVVTILAIAILPAAFILGGLYAIMLYMSVIFSAIAFGEILLKGNLNVYLRLSIALLIIYLLVEMPIVGFLISLLLIIFGMGLFFNYIWQVRKGKWLQK